MWANMKARFTIDGSESAPGPASTSRPTAPRSDAVGAVDMAHWPEQTLRGEVARRLSAHARDLLRRRAVAALRRRRLQRHVPSVQGRTRSVRAVQPATLAGVNDYRFPSLCGVAALDAQRFRGDRTRGSSSTAATPRFAFSIKPLGVRRDADRAVRRDLHRRRSRAALGFLRARAGCGSPAARPAATCSSGRWAAFSEHHGDGQVTVDAAARRRADDRVARDGARHRCRSSHARVGAVRAAAARRSRADRRRGHVPLRSATTIESTDGRFATERTHVTFDGSTAWGGDSRLPVPRDERATGRKATRCSPAS